MKIVYINEFHVLHTNVNNYLKREPFQFLQAYNMDDCTKFAQAEDETSLCTWCLCICLVLCTITAITFIALFAYKTKQLNQQGQPIGQQTPPEQTNDCAAMCAANKNCKGYVYDSIAKTCTLKME